MNVCWFVLKCIFNFVIFIYLFVCLCVLCGLMIGSLLFCYFLEFG